MNEVFTRFDLLIGYDLIISPSTAYLQAKRFLDPASIFQSDVDEAKQRVQESIETLLLFRCWIAFPSLHVKYTNKQIK
jgi:hypothetical protein